MDVRGRLFSARFGRDFDEGDVVGRWRCGGGFTKFNIFFGLSDNDFFKDWSGSMVDTGTLMVVVVVVVVVVAVMMGGEEHFSSLFATRMKSDHRL